MMARYVKGLPLLCSWKITLECKVLDEFGSSCKTYSSWNSFFLICVPPAVFGKHTILFKFWCSSGWEKLDCLSQNTNGKMGALVVCASVTYSNSILCPYRFLLASTPTLTTQPSAIDFKDLWLQSWQIHSGPLQTSRRASAATLSLSSNYQEVS